MRSTRTLWLASVCAVTLLSACSQKSAPIKMHSGKAYSRPAPQDDAIPFRPVFNDVKQGPKAPSGSIIMKDLDTPVTTTVRPNPVRNTEPAYKPRSDHGTAQNIIPVAATGNAAPHGNTVPVKPGDTLYIIAQRYGVPAREIVEANNLKAPYTIASRKTLKIPSAMMAFMPSPADPAPHAPQPRQKPEIVQAEDGFRPFQVKPNLSRKGAFIWPVEGEVISRFGPQSGGLYNDGVNIAAPQGTPIRASMDGTVVYTGDELKSYGNLLILRHDNGWLTAYAHTQDIAVGKGDSVKQGQVVAHVGQSGNVKFPQIHFGIREGKKPLDPLQKISG